MIPRIEAGERLAAVSTAALSNNVGFENENDRQQLMEDLQRKAAGAPPAAPVKADPADLAGMGIGVVTDDDMPAIGDLKEWLGQSSSSGCEAQPQAEPVGEQDHG